MNKVQTTIEKAIARYDNIQAFLDHMYEYNQIDVQLAADLDEKMDMLKHLLLQVKEEQKGTPAHD